MNKFENIKGDVSRAILFELTNDEELRQKMLFMLDDLQKHYLAQGDMVGDETAIDLAKMVLGDFQDKVDDLRSGDDE